MDKNKTYNQAIEEIQTILDSFEKEDFDIDSLAAKVKTATQLIDLCKEKLRKAEEDVAAVLDKQ